MSCSGSFVLRKTWRYYRAIHYASQSASAIPSSPARAFSARPRPGGCPVTKQFHLRASSRLRASQRLLDQSSSHALLRSQIANHRRVARQKRQDLRTGSEHRAGCETRSHVAEQHIWDDAVAYYVANYAAKDLLFSTELIQLKDQLAISRIAMNSPAGSENSATQDCPQS